MPLSPDITKILYLLIYNMSSILKEFVLSKLHIVPLMYYNLIFIGQALDLLVSVSLKCYHSYTSDLSPVVLTGVLLTYVMGNLILRWASRLDAFSVYPFPT